MHPLLAKKTGQKVLLLGNEAIALAALEEGVKLISCYPGTPSSEVMDSLQEAAREFKAENGHAFPVHLEYSVNEKVALEVAVGAAISGVKSLAAMKHVGLNVAADPLLTAAYIGSPGGLVILSADDPGCHSSQNEQDNRHYARFASLPSLEPDSPAESYAMTREAFKISRQLQQPVLLRTTTRVNHLSGPVAPGGEAPTEDVEFTRDPGRFVPVPQVALKRHLALLEQINKARAISENSPFNKVRLSGNKQPFGVIASGVARCYLADALKLGGLEKEISILELGMTWPLPQQMITDFLKSCGNVLVLEEGASLLEHDVRAIAQAHNLNVPIQGKDAQLTEFAEFSTTAVLNRLSRWLDKPALQSQPAAAPDLPRRPPTLCPGCAHRAIYYAARNVFGDDAVFSSDIGCYTLGVLPPLRMADFLVCMGSSISAGSGFAKTSSKTVVGFIGDSTFFHSGMTGLANAVFNNHNILLVILDNGTTAMTGHQPNPGMDQPGLAAGSTRLDIEQVVRGLGVTQCQTVKGSNLAALTKIFKEYANLSGVRVVIAKEPCALYATRILKRKKTRVAVVKKQGAEAEAMFHKLGCPAFYRTQSEFGVDENLCSGCMLCLQAAPDTFGSKAV